MDWTNTSYVIDGQRKIEKYVILPIQLTPPPFKMCALFSVVNWIIIIQNLNNWGVSI